MTRKKDELRTTELTPKVTSVMICLQRMHFTQCIQTQKFRQERRKGRRTSNWSVQIFFHKTFLPIGEINIIMWEAYVDIKSMRRWQTKGSMSCQHFLRIIVIHYYRTWELPTIFLCDSKCLKYFREEHYKKIICVC